jgi:hypothetical protein
MLYYRQLTRWEAACEMLQIKYEPETLPSAFRDATRRERS